MEKLLHQGVILFWFPYKRSKIVSFRSFLLIALHIMHFKHVDSVIHISSILDYFINYISHTIGGCLLLIRCVYPFIQLSTRKRIQRGVIFMMISVILTNSLSEGVNTVLHLVRGNSQILRVADVLHLRVLSFKQTPNSVFVSGTSDYLPMETILDIILIVKCKYFRSYRWWLLLIVL